MSKGKKILVGILFIIGLLMIIGKESGLGILFIIIGAIIIYRNYKKQKENQINQEKQLEEQAEIEKRKKEKEEFYKNNSTLNFRVAGTNHYQKAIKEVQEDDLGVVDNSDKWEGMTNKEIEDIGDDTKYYEYELVYFWEDDVSFVPEPDNKFDKDAIRIEICDELVGYVPRELTNKIKDIKEKITSVEATILGGRYKTYDYESNKAKINKGSLNIDIEIVYKK